MEFDYSETASIIRHIVAVERFCDGIDVNGWNLLVTIQQIIRKQMILLTLTICSMNKKLQHGLFNNLMKL